MSKSFLISHSPILSPLVRVFFSLYFKETLCVSLKLSALLRVLQLPNKKLIQAKLHELLGQELGGRNE